MSIVTFPSGLKWDVRDDTTDWNTVFAAGADGDEYGLTDVPVFGALVFDLGSHIGGCGVWLATRGARVVLVEPIPSNVEAIKRNLELNGTQALAIVEAALGTDRICLGPEGDAHEFIGGMTGISDETSARWLKVQRTSFTELVNRYGLPDIVKIDCEGGEWGVLTGPDIQNVPLIVGEYHPLGTYRAPDIARLLPDHDVTVGESPDLGGFRAVRR
jgi:FkbM family methyltransferase